MKQQTLTWDKFDNLVKQLAEKIPKDKYNKLYAIHRGGWIVGVCLSHLLNIPVFDSKGLIEIVPTAPILLVDEIVDTGKTVESIKRISALFNNSHNVHVASLFVNLVNCPKEWYPNFFMEEVDCWQVFPWEAIREEAII
jgi:hypoxanthine phosphoribosyltransferase